LFLIGFCLEKGRWYAKRFMHPDIVEQYNYIFLWDEDLGVKNFNASRYCVYQTLVIKILQHCVVVWK
jgi:hypothetical protein